MWYEISDDAIAEKIRSAEGATAEILEMTPDEEEMAEYFGVLDALSEIVILSDRFDEFHNFLNEHLRAREVFPVGDIPTDIDRFEDYTAWVSSQLETRQEPLRILFIQNNPSDDIAGIVVDARDCAHVLALGAQNRLKLR